MTDSINLNQSSITLDQLSQYQKSLGDDAQLRQTDGGVQLYKGSWVDKLKSAFGFGPSAAEKQQLSETTLRTAITNSYDPQIADKVLGQMQPELTSGGGSLSDVIARAKGLAKLEQSLSDLDEAERYTGAASTQTPTTTAPSSPAMANQPTAASRSGPPSRLETVSKKLVDLQDQAAQNKQSLDDFFADIGERHDAIAANRKQHKQKMARRRAATFDGPSKSRKSAAELRAEIRANNARQGRLYLERIDKQDFFGTLLKNARIPGGDLLGDNTGFEAATATYTPPVTKKGAEKAIVEAFRNYEPPADDPTKVMSALTDVDKEQIALAALKDYLALPPDPPTND